MFDYFDRQIHILQEIWNHEPNIADNEMKSLLSNPTDLFLQLKLMTDSTVHSTSGLFLLIFGWVATVATDAAVHCGQPVLCLAFYRVFPK